MTFNPETGKHRIRAEQAPAIIDWIWHRDGVNVWHVKGGTDEQYFYGRGNTDRHPDPRAKKAPTTWLSHIDDFEVEILEEVFRKTLPATVRPGVALSEELIEAYTKEFEKHYDAATGGQDPPNSRFEVEPNKVKPWLYDGVVYAVKEAVPLRAFALRNPIDAKKVEGAT